MKKLLLLLLIPILAFTQDSWINIDIHTDNNIGIGLLAMNGATTGNNNIGIGANAGDALTTGTTNVLMGLNAGGALTTTNNNIVSI